MTRHQVKEYINSIPKTTIDTYSNYWNTIAPKNDMEYFRRWQFAFLSVHTSWKSNITAYIAVDNTSQPTEKQQMQELITYTKVGLIKMRTEGMWKFQQDYWANPKLWRKQDDENWDQFRDRTMNMCHGLGYAKSAFAIELCYPNECEVTCLDTHGLQMYGYSGKGTPSAAKYKSIERHWVKTCKEYGCSPFIARDIRWNDIQQQPNSKYWTYVFEQPTTPDMVSQIT